jgi:hypothetical protein
LRLSTHELVGKSTERGPGERRRDVEPERMQVARNEPIERAGFIDAPVIGPPNIASSPTVPPIAIAAASPTARVSVATLMITNIKKKVRISSHRNACPCEPDGSVPPTLAWSPSDARRSAAAAMAPATWASQ